MCLPNEKTSLVSLKKQQKKGKLHVQSNYLQVLLTARHEGIEYGDVQLSRQRRAINSDLLLANRHIYAAAGKQLYKVPTADCSKHTTCSTCLQSADPYCGWCTLQNECVERQKKRQLINAFLQQMHFKSGLSVQHCVYSINDYSNR